MHAQWLLACHGCGNGAAGTPQTDEQNRFSTQCKAPTRKGLHTAHAVEHVPSPCAIFAARQSVERTHSLGLQTQAVGQVQRLGFEGYGHHQTIQIEQLHQMGYDTGKVCACHVQGNQDGVEPAAL